MRPFATHATRLGKCVVRGLLCRSFWLVLFVGAPGVALLPASAHAGSQQPEKLADRVRTALSAKIAGDSGADVQAQFDSVTDKVQWLAQMAALLPHTWKPTYEQRVEFLNVVHYEATRAGIEPELVLGLIKVESNFRRYAISSAGARGYMQVMPFWVDKIGNGDPAVLFDLRVNIRFGCTILRHYLDIESGDLFRALGRYNGSLGRARYPNKVLAAWRRFRRARGAGS